MPLLTEDQACPEPTGPDGRMTKRDFSAWSRRISRSTYKDAWVLEQAMMRGLARKKLLARASIIVQQIVQRGLATFPDQDGKKTPLPEKR